MLSDEIKIRCRDAVGWRRAVLVSMSVFLMSSSWICKSRKAVSQRRSSPKGFFSPAKDGVETSHDVIADDFISTPDSRIWDLRRIWLPPTIFLVGGIALVAFVVVNLLRFTLRAPSVNSEVVCASISAYLMFGLMWTMAYFLVDQLIRQDVNIAGHQGIE